MAGEAQVDLIDSFAYPLPITVICELLGVPAQRRPEFHDWSSVVVTGVLAGLELFKTASVAMVCLLRELIAAKRAAPADDLLSALVAVRDGVVEYGLPLRRRCSRRRQQVDLPDLLDEGPEPWPGVRYVCFVATGEATSRVYRRADRHRRWERWI